MVATVFRDRQQTQYLSAILALVLVVNVVFLGSVGVIFTPVETPGPEPMSDLETHDLPAAYDEAEPT